MEQQPLLQPLSKVVLSLDDDVEVCALLEHLLWPHRVIGVAHSYVALELLAREAFDLFILDVRLPDMDGLQLCARIRHVDPNAPIVFCSGAATAADRLAAMRAGASRYYGKPLEPDLFRDDIEQLLYEAEDRNRGAESVAHELLSACAEEGVLGALEGDGSAEMSAVRAAVYARFIEAGGTHAYFMRAWPGMLERTMVGARSPHPLAPALGRHGG